MNKIDPQKTQSSSINLIDTQPLKEIKTSHVEWISIIAAGLVVIMSLLILSGWLFKIPDLIAPLAGHTTTKANTALCMLLCGISIISTVVARRTGSRTWRLTARITAGVVVLVGLLTLTECYLHCNLGIDQLLAEDIGDHPGAFIPGRMGPNTAMASTFSGMALSLCGFANPKWRRDGFTLMVIVLAISILSLTGYAYGVSYMYQMKGFTQMATGTRHRIFIAGVQCVLCLST